VAVLDSAESSARAALAIALHERLLEDLTTTGGVLDGSANLLLRSIGAHNTVLTGHLVLGALAELRLDLLVLLDGGLEATVDPTDLGAVPWARCIRAGLDLANTVGEGTVESHGLGGEGVELAVGLARGRAVGIVEGTLLDHAELLQVLFDGVDTTVDVAALVQDGIGVAVGRTSVVGQRGHLQAVSCK
jgi:hypothetical protein